MLDLFGFREKLDAFWSEFWMVAVGALCVVAAIVLLSIRIGPQLLERWTGLDALKRTMAYVLLGVALFLSGQFMGYRKARDLSQEAALRAEIARQQALVAARESTAAEIARRTREIAAAKASADLAADRIAANNRRLEQLQRNDDALSHARDSASCLDLGGLQRVDAVR